MKQLLLISLLFINVSCNAQKVKIGPAIATCETGTEKAITDFNNEDYQIFEFGMYDMSKDDGFRDFYKDYMLEKYDIKLSHKGDVVMPNDKCYSDKMRALLKTKLGDDVFESIKKEARTEFEKKKG